MFKAKEENVKFLSNVGIARIPFSNVDMFGMNKTGLIFMTVYLEM